ncbi:hypothetical protein ES703_79144 [subsurface metagenome]
MRSLIFIVITTAILCTDVTAYTFSGIDIVNVVGDYPSNHYDAVHTDLWPVSDGLDQADLLLEDDFCTEAFWGGGYVYSEVGSQKCLRDYRPCSSLTPFQLRLFFCGDIPDIANYLWIDYYVDASGETFDDKRIILESDRLLYGFAVDVRRVIEIGYPYGGGVIQLEKVPAGLYDITNPYGSATLHIGTMSLGDLNGDGICDFTDLSCMANDWLVPQGKYQGDISGVAGIPDGFVDLYDLREMAQGWLEVFSD